MHRFQRETECVHRYQTERERETDSIGFPTLEGVIHDCVDKVENCLNHWLTETTNRQLKK